MSRLIALCALSFLAAAGLAGTVSAQVVYPPYSPYAYPGGRAAAIADQHRYENERLRAQAQASAALARQQQQETRLRLLDLEVARRQADGPASTPRPLYSPEQERTLREGAAERRARTAEGLSQIDDWLNRAD